MAEHFILIQERKEELTVRPARDCRTPWTVRGSGMELRFCEKAEALDALAFLEGRFPDDSWALEGDGSFTLV
ncbi:hypothetical protein QJ043_01270 [Olsenella sp. YH-ols2217]|uniref:Uncharacterized protein n=1 Tax=Kribbibacterium absianum TaxID=3044210 RepID=A0ABT6ZI33_9ACTN|nr:MULTISPECIES: hypothetical protein [unclassified Olsenella]MDJ1121228.1 hypothetical protein [Olsenella sp. YH-ols2216]MDJ1128718.1 hypothetical protein [Olsenella sp. YH-ols2217]